MDLSHLERELKAITEELAQLDERRSALVTRKKEIETQIQSGEIRPTLGVPLSVGVTNRSPAAEKIALFRELFRGREDVYALRWESTRGDRHGYQPACDNEWKRGVCIKPHGKCKDCTNRVLLPVTDLVVRNHLLGEDPDQRGRRKNEFIVGIFPLLPDETCHFLALDFDKENWMEDVKAFLETCKQLGVPAVLERSRSGNGGHVWIFFAEPISARTARQFGSLLLTKTMERRPEIGFDSYDRLFPNQDTMPRGGFGNLIALPLQGKAREEGNSVFVDENFVPYDDQWVFLSSVQRLVREEVELLIQTGSYDGFGVGLPATVAESLDQPWELQPSRESDWEVEGPLPQTVTLWLADQLYIAREGLPPKLRNRLIRMAAFQNPKFYEAQALRLSTANIPRVICCAEEFPRHIGLPRGCFEEVRDLFASLGVGIVVTDKRQSGNSIDIQFSGKLRPEQKEAADQLLAHDTGVLAAATGFGKTVVGAYIVAKRAVNTLIIVHRQQLLDQWVEQLAAFLQLSPERIGKIGSGKHRPTGVIDVAMIQSLNKRGQVDDVVADYGHIVIDECHHISAHSFEEVVRRCKAKYVTGLSATVTRKDGHHPIIFMQCGPVRYEVNARIQAAKRSIDHKVYLRETGFQLPVYLQSVERPAIHDVYAALAVDDHRNELIVKDVLHALEEGRSPVVITERKEHLDYLANRLSAQGADVIVLQGGMAAKQRRAAKKRLVETAGKPGRVLLATGRYLGEGFDDPTLDTLFLTFPISWRGTLTQYVGRLHREHADKTEVIVYDYADSQVPMLDRMLRKRIRGYRALGYQIGGR